MQEREHTLLPHKKKTTHINGNTHSIYNFPSQDAQKSYPLNHH